jgi:RNA polymerase sigma-70 factor (ECF subfamily)
LLRDVEGQPAEEVAKILKLSIPAVKSRLRRARMFLREQLHGYMKA